MLLIYCRCIYKIIFISVGIVFKIIIIIIIASIVFDDQHHHAQEKLESFGEVVDKLTKVRSS